jgi:hypothetical protein
LVGVNQGRGLDGDRTSRCHGCLQGTGASLHWSQEPQQLCRRVTEGVDGGLEAAVACSMRGGAGRVASGAFIPASAFENIEGSRLESFHHNVGKALPRPPATRLHLHTGVLRADIMHPSAQYCVLGLPLARRRIWYFHASLCQAVCLLSQRQLDASKSPPSCIPRPRHHHHFFIHSGIPVQCSSSCTHHQAATRQNASAFERHQVCHS